MTRPASEANILMRGGGGTNFAVKRESTEFHLLCQFPYLLSRRFSPASINSKTTSANFNVE